MFLSRAPWLLDEHHFRSMLSRARTATAPTRREDLDAFRQRMAAETRTPQTRGPKGSQVAIVPVHGILEQWLSETSYFFGGTSTVDIQHAIEAAIAGPADSVVLHIDSPGGSSFGVSELADYISQAKRRKPIHAVSDSLCASAAYWVASVCTSIGMTPGGYVGSVGVYSVHVDASRALDKAGLDVSIVSAGKYKTEFSDTAPLSEDARDWLQRDVDRLYRDFVGAVARGRGVSTEHVLQRFGQGRIVAPQDALAARMVDRIEPFQATLQRLIGAAGERRAEQLQRRAEHAARVRADAAMLRELSRN